MFPDKKVLAQEINAAVRARKNRIRANESLGLHWLFGLDSTLREPTKKFTLMGLPGVGKSTTARECAAIIKSRGFDCEVKSTDAIIRSRIKADDPVILAFEKVYEVKIPAEIFAAAKPTTAFIKMLGEEPMWRNLEEMFIYDIIRTATATDWFDLGGKAPLKEGVRRALHNNWIIPIFLYAEPETIDARLSANDGWKTRSHYLLAGENGWRNLAKQHREERLDKYINIAPIIIDVEAKTPSELAREILSRVIELEKACAERDNVFTRRNKHFFNP